MFVQLFFKYLTFEKAWSALYIKAINGQIFGGTQEYFGGTTRKNTDLNIYCR
jgi:hypothetical protein